MTTAAATTSSSAAAAADTTSQQQQVIPSHAWEDTGGEHAWDKAVQEDEEGRIVVAAGETLAQAIRRRRKRMEQNDYAQRNRRVVRDMIRYVYVIIDASRWMRQKDPVLPPGTRLDVTVNDMLQSFVQEYYDQNPLSHLGFVLVKNGEAEIITQLSGSSKTHKLALQSVAQLAASEGPNRGGEFSLQNGLEVAGLSLGHQPRHGSREIVVLTAALSTCDPGCILTETLPKLQRAKIRVSSLALSAEMHICRKLAEETSGTMGVCLDKAHFRDWLWEQCVPPPALKDRVQESACDMVQMGFPTRVSSEVPSLVHGSREKTLLARTAFTCPQCQAKNSELPTDCAVCGLKLAMAPHLARSFHHLFPVAPFVERPVERPPLVNDSTVAAAITSSSSSSAPVTSSSGNIMETAAFLMDHYMDASLLVSSNDDDRCCYACLKPLAGVAASPAVSSSSSSKKNTDPGTTTNEDVLLRYQCPDCHNFFCVDCDAYLHETLHNCPGCLSCS